MRILVTGGASFVGSAVCRFLVAERGATVCNVDSLTTASSLASLAPVASHPRYQLRRADVCDRTRLAALVQAFAPDAVVHLAGHVRAPGDSAALTAATDADCIGNWSMLTAVDAYWAGLSAEHRRDFRFVQLSRGAEPGSTGANLADRLALDWHRTYAMPVVVARAPMIFGQCQSLDSFVPRLVLAARDGLPMAVEGSGSCQRDWVHVDDIARALLAIVHDGCPGAVYDIGGGQPRSDLSVADRIADVMNRYVPTRGPHQRLITFIANDAGGDARASVDPTMLQSDTGWRATMPFDQSLGQTVHWYLDNESWWRPLRDARSDARLLGFDGLRQSA